MGFIKFLGTAGARFVMIKQLRSSAGIWLAFKSTNIMIDPGPGALIRCNKVRPALDPTKLDALILTHKHLDHSNDINVMIEAMTEGGFKKRGVLFAPADALGSDGVVFHYVQRFPHTVTKLCVGDYAVGDVAFSVPMRNVHSVETYGLKFKLGSEIISFVSDTKLCDALFDAYKDSTILVLNVVFYKSRSEYDHLSLDEALELAKAIRPRKIILTHFGMSLLRAKPHLLQESVRKELPHLTFAHDGLKLDIDE